MIDNPEMTELMNYYGSKGIPFIFIIDFDAVKPVIFPLSHAKKHNILYDFDGYKNYKRIKAANRKIDLEKFPIAYDQYKEAFDYVIENQKSGNSYLLNLTFPTKVKINLSFREIFHRSNARYKLFLNDELVVFSPEAFIRITGGKISSYPMKGTIDASADNAEKIIMEDDKEFAEHLTIVDLIRNDLAIVAKNVVVEKFRYVEKIKTNERDLLQVSSMVTGTLGRNYQKRIGDIISALLPAGSVTGAPKKKTVEIIREAEKYDRGYYTGIFGCMKGNRLDSAVMIRYMEKKDGEVWYKSGGGITVYSDPVSEYKELVDKVYVPFG